jgi:hypothetical protein
MREAATARSPRLSEHHQADTAAPIDEWLSLPNCMAK